MLKNNFADPVLEGQSFNLLNQHGQEIENMPKVNSLAEGKELYFRPSILPIENDTKTNLPSVNGQPINEIQKIKGNLLTKAKQENFNKFIAKSLNKSSVAGKTLDENLALGIDSKPRPIQSIDTLVKLKQENLIKIRQKQSLEKFSVNTLIFLLKEYQKCLNKINVELNVNSNVTQGQIDDFKDMICSY